MADTGTDSVSDLEAFRAQARAWLDENVPASLRGAPDMTMEQMEGGVKPTADAHLWRQRMGAKGWGTPTWPTAYGGGGLSSAQARVLQQEMARLKVTNPIVGMGPGMFGSTLLEYGNDAQKARHLPPIVKGELRWCQGYSEPGAGSDLASLSTKAEDKGDHFLVNGQKIWTSGAQFADWCFCLVRTDTTRKHDGISFLLIDMHSPGVLARPIKMISGASGQCETFFTDVQVPKENLVGPLNGGWTIAKRLLQHERQGLSGAAGAPSANPNQLNGSVLSLAKHYVGLNEEGRLSDSDLRNRLTLHLMEVRALGLTGGRLAQEAKSNRGPNAASSVLKNVGSMNRKEMAELAVEIMGFQGLGWEAGDAFSGDEVDAIKTMLRSKAGTIAGGSSEVQLNIISKRILGLPDATRAV